MQTLKLLALLSLACASGAAAAPDTPAKPASPAPATPDKPAQRADACQPGGKVVFEIDHKVAPGAKMATSTIKLFANGAWTRDDTDADGNAQGQTSGCLAKADAKQVADSLRSAPWKVTTARIRCMAVSTTFTEYQLDGKPVFTQRLCSGQSLDAKSSAALDAATKRVEQAAGKSAP
jgi:hypothetical protein